MLGYNVHSSPVLSATVFRSDLRITFTAATVGCNTHLTLVFVPPAITNGGMIAAPRVDHPMYNRQILFNDIHNTVMLTTALFSSISPFYFGFSSMLP